MEPLTGLDAAFLAIETATTRPYVAGVLVLDPPEEDAREVAETATGPAAGAAATRAFAAIRSVIEQRLDRVPRLRQRVQRAPLGLCRPVWVDAADFDLDRHVRRAALRAPGGRRELDELVATTIASPLDPDRPLWEVVVVDGLAGGRTAVIARLHHAISDGEAGATVMAAFLDLDPAPCAIGWPSPLAATQVPAPPAAATRQHCASALAGPCREATEACRRILATTRALTAHNRTLASQGQARPPAPFEAPRTSLNGSVGRERQFATFRVPVDDLELVRRACGGAGQKNCRPTVNDVILTAVGGALMRYLGGRGEAPPSSLVALVPVSTQRREVPPPGQPAAVGNYVSGMLVPLATTEADPRARLVAVARAAAVAKAQEDVAGGDFLETVLRAVPPVVVSALMRGAGTLRLFDRVPPPFNVAVSNVVAPDVSLRWAGRPVVGVYPVGPVADGVGLNVTAMTYRGSVHFGLLAASELVPNLDELAVLLDDSLAELVLAALDDEQAPWGRRSR